jgi:three-Cys-motif partner protein
MSPPIRFDEIGYWSEIKLDIIREYAVAYSRILAAQPGLRHAYVDAFAGSGRHLSEARRVMVPGSPVNALLIQPPFRRYFLIDLDGDKVQQLRALAAMKPDVEVLQGDCNEILLDHVLPRLQHADRWRALCVLDPYGLHLDWRVIRAAGQSRTTEIFLNFPVMDMNMNALWRRPDVDVPGSERMTRFWGDASWRSEAYAPDAQQVLFGPPAELKLSNADIAEAFRVRLQRVAGFAYVPPPIPMRNSRHSVVYYLYFAGPNATGAKIVGQVFDKYRDRQG